MIPAPSHCWPGRCAPGRPQGQHIPFAENSFLNEGKWVSRESFQGAGFLIVSVPIHDP
jgi:hypothetical protein